MKKQLTALFLALVLCMGLCTPALAKTEAEFADGKVTIITDEFNDGDTYSVLIKDSDGSIKNVDKGTVTTDSSGNFTWTGSVGGA